MEKKSIEDRIINKIFESVSYFLERKIIPNIKVNKVADLDIDEIKRLKKVYGIEGVILDIDETVRKNMKKIPKCNEEWIDNLKKELKVIAVSNGIDKKIENYLKLKEIKYISFARKPMKANFKKACEIMNLEPEKVLVIGNSLIADIYGGNRNNMMSALVKDVEDR